MGLSILERCRGCQWGCFRDVAILKYASGGASNVPITVVLGNGDGTFQAPPSTPFYSQHSRVRYVTINTIVFGDFNSMASVTLSLV